MTTSQNHPDSNVRLQPFSPIKEARAADVISQYKLKEETIHFNDIGDVVIKNSPRSKHMKLRVKGDLVTVTKPKYIPAILVKKFVIDQKHWIKDKRKQYSETTLKANDKASRYLSIRFQPGSRLTKNIEGNELVINIPPKIASSDRKVQDFLIEALVPIWRKEAKEYLPERLDELSEQYGLGYNQLRMKFVHTRWGSCSVQNNINLNIQLMRLDSQLIDHVLKHELCHTRHHDHSKAFWSLFESIEPNAKRIRKELKSQHLY